MLPGFHLQTLRRKPRSAQQKLADKIALLKQKSFKQIGFPMSVRLTNMEN